MNAKEKALDFIRNQTQFHLGFLPTEQASPLTKNLDKEFGKSSTGGVRNLQSVDRNVLSMLRQVLPGAAFAKLVSSGREVIANGGRIVCSGCGATGRLSILLESMWRECWQGSHYADQVFSIMTGGDYALVKSVESFEDFQEFGRRQVRDLEMTEQDMLIAITEGGETSSVLGTVEEALQRNAKVFLLFNNPAELLAKHLERSRKAIENPAVTVLDLSCGPMALAGSTRMQATTSEQLVAGGALEIIACGLKGVPVPDYLTEFEALLNELESGAAVIGAYIDYEAEVYRNKGKITYFADDYLLDIFTDTTERSPTFMLPPFRKMDDRISPAPWAFVKNPLRSTPEVWEKSMHRSLRCLEWTSEDYRRMNAPESVQANPPAIRQEELLKFQVGRENPEERCTSPEDTAVLVTVSGYRKELADAFDSLTSGFRRKTHLAVGGECSADFKVEVHCKEAPLHLMEHMALKLVLNTASTGIMVKTGRVTGNWMSWVDCTNKKLVDRAVRLVSEIGKLDYETSCIRLFEALETLEQSQLPQKERPSAVQYVLKNL